MDTIDFRPARTARTTAPADSHEACGCEEGRRSGALARSTLSRRTVLAGAGALGLAGGVAKFFGTDIATQYAMAGAGYDGDTVVVISLRGGFDGLSALVPVGDPGYAPARPVIGIPKSRVLQVDSMFGFHPALAPLKALFDQGKLAAVHAVGQPNPTRSHFAAMEQMENAAPGSDVRTGWLDRMIGLTPAETFGSVALGTSAPASMRGPNPDMVMKSVKSFGLLGAGDQTQLASWTKALSALNGGGADPVQAPASAALDALATMWPLRSATYTPAGGAQYPAGSFGDALRDLAQLIKAGVGIRAATIDVGGWDMHINLGTVDGGWMVDKLTELGRALAAFAADLGPKLNDVTVVTLSEFGRRLAENQSGGVDHGLGNVSFLLGGGVVGGKVHGSWPGLTADKLVAGDLAGTTDYRTILAEILQKRAKLSASTVFPGLSGDPLGVVRAR